MNTDNGLPVSEMTKILKEKETLLQDILKITESQNTSLTEEGLDELRKLIDEKQERIEKIDKLDERFKVIFQDLKKNLSVKSIEEIDPGRLPGVKELKEKTADVMALITRILDLEKANNVKGQELLDQLGNEIKKINQMKMANQAYAPKAYDQTSYFIDKKK
jgi:preprotein translocase subunit SecA